MAVYTHEQRYHALEACLGVLDSVQRLMGRNWTMLEPKPGYESAWDNLEEQRRVIQEMMREERTSLDGLRLGERKHG